MLEQFGITRRLPHLYRITRPRKVHVERILDHARPRREQDDTVGQRQSFTEIMRHEQYRLLFALPDPEQDVVHIDLGVGISAPNGSSISKICGSTTSVRISAAR